MIVVVYLVVLVAGFFFLVVRPQRRQMAARRALIASVGVGDEVVTSGGIHGTVRSLGDDTVELEIAPAVVVTVARGCDRRPPHGIRHARQRTQVGRVRGR